MSSSANVWAEFRSADDLVAAASTLRDRGRAPSDSYTPYALPELDAVLELERPTRLSLITFLGAVTGGTLAYLVIWWTAAIDYPLNVGGRPLNSVVADIPIIFESSVLASAVTAFFTFLFSSGLPRLSHPLDAQPGFRDTTIDRFWLGIRTPSRSTPDLANELRELGALRVQPAPEPEP